MFYSLPASRWWAISFTKRHALRSVSLHGDGGFAKALDIVKEITELREKVKDYSFLQICNMEETDLFYKLISRRTYVLKSKEKRSVRGVKGMRAKNGIIAYLYTNVDVSNKVPLAVTRKLVNLRCFKMGKPFDKYFSQNDAWSGTAVFRQWFWEVFLPQNRAKTSHPIALVMDSCRARGSDLTDITQQVHIFPFPPNCTSIHQTMDLGIIAA